MASYGCDSGANSEEVELRGDEEMDIKSWFEEAGDDEHCL